MALNSRWMVVCWDSAITTDQDMEKEECHLGNLTHVRGKNKNNPPTHTVNKQTKLQNQCNLKNMLYATSVNAIKFKKEGKTKSILNFTSKWDLKTDILINKRKIICMSVSI